MAQEGPVLSQTLFPRVTLGLGPQPALRGHSLLSPQLCRKHKVGVLYCKAGQSSEEEMYNNEEAGPAFEEFLALLGEKVCLRGFGKYAAQLDTKSRSLLRVVWGLAGQDSLLALCLPSEGLSFPASPPCCFPHSRLHRHPLPLHNLPGLRDHVPRLHDAPLHPQQ